MAELGSRQSPTKAYNELGRNIPESASSSNTIYHEYSDKEIDVQMHKVSFRNEVNLVEKNGKLNYERNQFYLTVKTNARAESFIMLEQVPGTTDIDYHAERQGAMTDYVFNYLLKFWRIRGHNMNRDFSKETEMDKHYCTLAKAVLSFCILYRDRWRKTFKKMRDRLLDLNCFVFYCCTTIPQRGYHYFYSYLQMIAVIFELTLYCLENGRDYIEVAQNVIRFSDFHHFYEAGFWSTLIAVSIFIEKLTRCMRALVYPNHESKSLEHVCQSSREIPEYQIPSLSYILKILDNFSSKRKLGLNKQELYSFLSRQNLEETESSPSTIRQNVVKEAKHLNTAKLKLQRMTDCCKILLPFRDLKVPRDEISNDFLIDIDFWMENDILQQTAVSYFGKLLHQSISEKEIVEYLRIWEYEESSFPDPEKPRHTNSKEKNSKKKKISSHTDCQTSFAEDASSELSIKCVSLESNNVEWAIEKFSQLLPLFYDIFWHNHIAKAPKDFSFPTKSKDFYILSSHSFFLERIEKVFLPDSCKRMVAYKLPFINIISIVPLEVQRALDLYIRRKQYVVFKDCNDQVIVLAGADPNLLVYDENRPVWFLQDGEEIDFEIEKGAIELFRKLLSNMKQFQGRNACVEEAANTMYYMSQIHRIRGIFSDKFSIA